MNKNTSISLGPYYEYFVKNRLAVGRYKNASEVIGTGLRLLEEEENKTITLRSSILEGLESGLANNFDAEMHLKELKAKRVLDG